jgi:hypothetical protein
MRLTKSQLRQIIKEELEVILTNEEAGEFFGEEVQKQLEEAEHVRDTYDDEVERRNEKKSKTARKEMGLEEAEEYEDAKTREIDDILKTQKLTPKQRREFEDEKLRIQTDGAAAVKRAKKKWGK